MKHVPRKSDPLCPKGHRARDSRWCPECQLEQHMRQQELKAAIAGPEAERELAARTIPIPEDMTMTIGESGERVSFGMAGRMRRQMRRRRR